MEISEAYKQCEELITLLDDGVVWLEVAEEIKDMQYTSEAKGLTDMSPCFFMTTSVEKAIGALDAARFRGYISDTEFSKAESLIKPLEGACELDHKGSRELFSRAIKHTRELMAGKSCVCLIEKSRG